MGLLYKHRLPASENSEEFFGFMQFTVTEQCIDFIMKVLFFLLGQSKIVTCIYCPK